MKMFSLMGIDEHKDFIRNSVSSTDANHTLKKK